MRNKTKNNASWRIEHFSEDEESREELAVAIMLMAEGLAEKRPELVDGLMASIATSALLSGKLH